MHTVKESSTKKHLACSGGYSFVADTSIIAAQRSKTSNKGAKATQRGTANGEILEKDKDNKHFHLDVTITLYLIDNVGKK